MGLRLMVIYRKVVESNGLVWLISDKETRRLSVLFVNERKRKEKGEAASVCECEGSKLMTEGSNGRVETMETD